MKRKLLTLVFSVMWKISFFVLYSKKFGFDQITKRKAQLVIGVTSRAV